MNIENPTIKGTDGDDTITTHPSFAQIKASRVSASGRGIHLYDSDFKHNHFITIEINTSELRRGLNRDWHRERNHIVELAMTESQWATFVSSLNVGSGVPCTLQNLNGKPVPGLPAPKKQNEQFHYEMLDLLKDTLQDVETLRQKIEESSLSKTKKEEINRIADKIGRELKKNLPYVANSFGRHMENMFEKAKQEIHGYIGSTLQRIGIKNAEEKKPFQIDHE